MKIPDLGFSLVEKFAIVQAVDAVIVADGKVRQGEINALGQLMERMDFDSNFILQARNMSPDQGRSLLDEMPYEKKMALAEILGVVAKSDGYVHKKETAFMTKVFSAIGISKDIKKAK